jgi:hypothetical protein
MPIGAGPAVGVHGLGLPVFEQLGEQLRGNWDAIEALWFAGELTDDESEDHFIDDVIVEDIGEGTDGWQFPGGSYSVELR